MTSTPIAVSLTSSFAYRDPDGVHVVVGVPSETLPPILAEVQLSRGQQRVRVRADVVGQGSSSLVSFTFAPTPGRRAWRLAVRGDETGFIPVEARLLARPGQAVALIPGPIPATRLAPPLPRAAPPTSATRLDEVSRALHRTVAKVRAKVRR
jgi:hypothetical protein